MAAMPATAEKPGPEPAVVPIPRRGRIWIVLGLAIALGLPGLRDRQHLHPEGRPRRRPPGQASPKPRKSSAACRRKVTALAPPTRRSQSRSSTTCSARAAGTIFLEHDSRPWWNKYARPGDVKLLYRHYSNSESPQELGFYGAEAAAQQGYGWQYTYLFFRNQNEAKKFGRQRPGLPRLGSGGDRGTERARMAGIPGRKRRLRRRDEPEACRAMTNSAAASASARDRRRSSAGRKGPETLQDGPSPAGVGRQR